MYALTEVLNSLLGEKSGYGINAMYRCPLHVDNTPSLSAHQEDGVWLCHSCGERGDLQHLANLVGKDLGSDILWDMAIRSVKEVPPLERNFAPLANALYERGVADKEGDAIIRKFLEDRGIRSDARHHFWIGWDGKRMSFPYWSDDSRKKGSVTAIKYRDIHGRKSSETGSRRSIYNVEEVRGAGRVIICEGESDTMLAWSIKPRGYEVCGVPGASVARGQWEIWALEFLFAEKILIAFDADEAGDKGAALGMSILGDKAMRIRPDDGLDITDHYRVHGGLPR